MRKPDESLDEYIVRYTPRITPEPPPAVTLRRTGAVEVLEPLARSEVHAGPGRFAFKARHQPLWFRRFITVGSGALVVMAFVLVSAILVGINDRSSRLEVATNDLVGDRLTQHHELFTFDLSHPLTLLPKSGVADMVRSTIKRRPPRPSIHFAAHKPKRQSRPARLPHQPKFVPTTLVIYAKNGVINTRIEPWIQAGYKKNPTSNN